MWPSRVTLLCILLIFSSCDDANAEEQDDPSLGDELSIITSSSYNDGSKFNYSYTTQHGIKVHTTGTTQNQDGKLSIKGKYSYILPDGQVAEFEWYADEYGFHVDSDLLPVAPVFPFPPPWGPNAFRQILHAQKQKDQGLIYHGETNTWIKPAE